MAFFTILRVIVGCFFFEFLREVLIIDRFKTLQGLVRISRFLQGPSRFFRFARSLHHVFYSFVFFLIWHSYISQIARTAFAECFPLIQGEDSGRTSAS